MSDSDASGSDSENIEPNSASEDEDENEFDSDDEPSSVANPLEEMSSQPGPDSSDAELSDYEQIDEAVDDFTVQTILGQKTDDDGLFFTKFLNKSYIHCRWMNEGELLVTQKGEEMLARYLKRRDREGLYPSSTIPNLLAVGTKLIEKEWWEVDRIIGDCVVDGQDSYLVKWKALEYKDATWEWESHIDDKDAIDAYKERLEHSNPKKIPAKSRKPSINNFHPWETSTLTSKFGDELREYQVTGVNWLTYNWLCGRNTILADEMGLGKTVQTVATLCRLFLDAKVRGPFLIVAPMSTLPHWQGEFERWSDFNAVMLHGTEESRQIIIEREMTVYDRRGRPVEGRVRPDVVITTYETIGLCLPFFQSIQWRYLVADEGHKLKNYKGKRYIMMQKLSFEHCTILTGTPIQNNMTELWSLLHFINPAQFDDVDGFMEEYGEVMDAGKTQQIQEVIEPYLLRRKKSDVEKSLAPKEETIIEVEMTHIQKTFYKAMINDNAATLLRQITVNSLPALQNLAMQLRKVCNHPFLIKGAEDGIKQELWNKEGENLTETELHEKALIDASGKMILINKLLPKLKSGNHKVLIFSQMVKVLEILDRYLRLKGYMFERLDGGCSEGARRAAIERFNNEPEDFVFLLSTKAGGVGINLTAADTVIIHDSDWNPQNDLQAQARCHRIGQKNAVKVYRLITRGTYENEMFEKASLKLGLDHAILDGGNLNPDGPMKASEIEKLLRKGVYGILDENDTEIDKFCEADIDQILEHRSKVLKTDIISGGESKFSKATFDTAENETNKEFWSKVITGGVENEDSVRRCRSRSQEDFSDSGKKTIKDIIDRGYRGGPQERKVLKICLAFHRPDDVAAAAIQEVLLSDDSEADDADDVPEGADPETLFAKFGEVALVATDKAEKLITRVTFFRRLERVLYLVQGEDFEWPSISPEWAGPLQEYAIMYGLRKYGWKRFDYVFADRELLFKFKSKLTVSQAALRIELIMDEIEKLLVSDFMVIPNDFVPDLPAVWAEKHSIVISRVALDDDSLVGLFGAMRCAGLPPKTGSRDGEIDWDRVRSFGKLNNCSDESLKLNADLILELLNVMEEGAETIPWEAFEKLSSLSTRVKAKDLLALKKSLPWNTAIHEFCEQYKPDMNAFVAKAAKNPRFPPWWSSEHDLGLIMGLHHYGFMKLTSILVDTSYPFRQHIPAENLEDFEAAAAGEHKRKRVIKPKDLSVFDFLYRKSVRFTRAFAVVQSVMKKVKRRDEIDEKKQQKELDKLAIRPSEDGRYACVISKNLNIIKFGELQYESYNTKNPPIPIGYISERIVVNEETKEQDTYICEVQAHNGKPLYVLTLQPRPDGDGQARVWTSLNATDVWTRAMENQNSEGVRHQGAPMFGFANPRVRKYIETMEDKYIQEHGELPKKKTKKELAEEKKQRAMQMRMLQEQLKEDRRRQKEEKMQQQVEFSDVDASELTVRTFSIQIPSFPLVQLPALTGEGMRTRRPRIHNRNPFDAL